MNTQSQERSASKEEVQNMSGVRRNTALVENGTEPGVRRPDLGVTRPDPVLNSQCPYRPPTNVGQTL